MTDETKKIFSENRGASRGFVTASALSLALIVAATILPAPAFAAPENVPEKTPEKAPSKTPGKAPENISEKRDTTGAVFLPLDHPNQYYTAAQNLYGQFNYPGAFKALERALKEHKEKQGDRNLDVARIQNALGVAAAGNNGKYRDALDNLNSAETLYRELSGNETELALIYGNLGEVYKLLNDYSKALEWHQKALIIEEKALGKEDPATASTYNNLAMNYLFQGNSPKAREWFQKFLPLQEKALGKEHPDLAYTYGGMAASYQFQGNFPKALEWHRKALIIFEKILGKEHPQSTSVRTIMKQIYEQTPQDLSFDAWLEKKAADDSKQSAPVPPK